MRILGGSLESVLFNAVAHPSILLNKVLSPSNIFWLRDLLGVLLFLPFLAPAVLLLAAPLFAQHLLSSAPQQHTIFYTYAMTLAPFIFLALVFALGWVRKKAPMRLFFVMSVLVLLNVSALVYHASGIMDRYAPGNTRTGNDARREMLARILPKAPVLASFCFLPSLADRAELYAFHKVYSREHNKDGASFRVPDSVHWALIDFSDGFYQQALSVDESFTRQRVDAFLKEGRWLDVQQRGSVHLLRRD